MKKLVSICLLFCLAIGLTACAGLNTTTGDSTGNPAANSGNGQGTAENTSQNKAGTATGNLVIYCPHPLEFINPLVSEYETQTGVKVEVIAAGTGELLKRVESEQDNPLGDIFWGGSLSTMKPKMDLFENYQSANEYFVQDTMKNTEGPLTRFADIPSVIMVNTDLIGDIEVNGYEDLLNPALKGKIAH